jgi:hypothetical protein
LFELSILTKIFWFFFILSAIIMFIMIYYNIPLLLLIIFLFISVPYIQKSIIFNRRKKIYSIIKIHPNSDYFLILNKIWWKIVNKFL